jgi:hypothetical protein
VASAYGWVTILLYCLWLNEHTYFSNLDKLVYDEEECAQVRKKLSKYISEHGVFANLHATKDRDIG